VQQDEDVGGSGQGLPGGVDGGLVHNVAAVVAGETTKNTVASATCDG
jgi:hypothetical protein